MHYALVLLALGGLLALHELGHLVAARLLGVRVPRFVFGFGPPMASFRLGGTQFVVGAVPLGATVHIQGMNPHRAEVAEAASFRTLGPLRRALIILAGPLSNYLFALGVLFALYTSGTHVVVPLTVGTVRPGSEAARAQLLPGDRIDSVNGQALRTWTEFVEKVAVGVGGTLELRVDRHGEQRTVTVRPRADERGEGRIGVSQQYVYRTHAPGEALRHATVHTMNLAAEGVTMFTRLAKGEQARGGPTGPGALVRQESSDAASSGLDSVLRALVAASLALALLTLLPIPGLDGGRVVLLLVEAVSGRKLPPRVETVAQTVGFLASATVIVAVALAEIRGALPERFKSEAATVSPATAGPSATTGAPGVAPTAGAAVTTGASTPAIGGPAAPGAAGATATTGASTPAIGAPAAPGAAGATATTGASTPAIGAPAAPGAAGATATTGTGAPAIGAPAGATTPVSGAPTTATPGGTGIPVPGGPAAPPVAGSGATAAAGAKAAPVPVTGTPAGADSRGVTTPASGAAGTPNPTGASGAGSTPTAGAPPPTGSATTTSTGATPTTATPAGATGAPANSAAPANAPSGPPTTTTPAGQPSGTSAAGSQPPAVSPTPATSKPPPTESPPPPPPAESGTKDTPSSGGPSVMGRTTA
ncbi:M50 family metallopeptidase [Myxococcus sp. K38C18041901]|uniref:M50 family metallopeptidase n=1 Tax=Myxococcus guangdongensis TaxID=2906760 RepID=UPI0020A7922C|nr:M50 family metallopeptidase [Myxococcus guangdongensis]MCP3060666.1 M50 family metallopeptidase [Myxococcus guangdongensis]